MTIRILIVVLAFALASSAYSRPRRPAAATVAWTKVDAATGYRLYLGRASRTYQSPVTVSGTSYRVNGLTRGVRYYFAVKAVNSAGRSAYSVEKTYTP